MIRLDNNEFNNSWDIDVFMSLAKASVKAGGWVGYKDLYEKERPCNGATYFGMSIDVLVKLKYVNRLGIECNLTDKGLKRYTELQGA